MTQNTQHHTALVYTMVLFGLIAVFSYWYVYQLDQASDRPNLVPVSDIKININSIF